MCFRQFWDVITGVIMGTDVATDILQILEFSHTDGERARFLFYVSLGIYIFNAVLWTFIYLCIIYFWKTWAEGNENDPFEIPRISIDLIKKKKNSKLARIKTDKTDKTCWYKISSMSQCNGIQKNDNIIESLTLTVENEPLIPGWIRALAPPVSSPMTGSIPDVVGGGTSSETQPPPSFRSLASIPHRRLHHWVQRPIIGKSHFHIHRLHQEFSYINRIREVTD